METFSLGVDLGGTSIKTGLVNEKGIIYNKVSVETLAHLGPEAVIEQIKKSIYLSTESKEFNIKGIGIGAPGLVNHARGLVENPPNLPGWESIPLAKIIREEFNNNVFIENDANAAAIGELIYGEGIGIKYFIMITLGTGFGGGIIIDGKIYRGETGSAGEIGHLSIDYKGNNCKCGNIGCIETYSGINYLTHKVNSELDNYNKSVLYENVRNNGILLSPKAISDAANLGCDYSISIIKELGYQIGSAMASVCNVLDITTIIIGGGVAGFGNILFNEIENTIKAKILKPLRQRVNVRSAKLKNDAGIIGAASLVQYNL